MNNIKTILTILLTLQLFCTKGQTEFLVNVNPTTGIHSIIDTIPGVNYIYQGVTTFDKNNHRYIFQGIDFTGNNHLYCVDAISSTILSQPLIPQNIGELHYDNISNTLFGLYISSGQMFVASIDINTASTSIIATLPVVGYSDGTTFFDEANHAFVIQSSGYFYSTNVANGIITTTPAPTAFFEQQFDNTTGTLYGLVMSSPIQLANINVSSGSYTTVCSILTTGYSSTLNSFNEINHTYIFGSNYHLYSIDVNADSVISNPTFPVGLSGSQNVIELQFDNSNGTLYALHWGTNTTGIKDISNLENSDFNVFPNPISAKFLVSFNRLYKEINISIYNSFGQLVLKQAGYNTRHISVLNDNLHAGIYFISVTCDNENVGTKKLIVK